MFYKVLKIDNKYSIFELQSENIIKVFDNKLAAESYCNLMNLGYYGFCGWTPSFILKK